MKKRPHFPKVTLVGAGPGHEELITVKGLNAIKEADVIIYDALVNSKILQYNTTNAKLIFVGKRFGKASYKQEKINEILVNSAHKYKNVVRLKGGDPFVFGRGSEEIEHLESHSITTEVIPGVSSALAVPATQGIPLTKRGTSTSFWVVTGTTKDGSLSKDLVFAAQSSATLVVLMGLRKVNDIVEIVSQYRGKHTPIAILQNGTLNNESSKISTLSYSENLTHSIDYSLPGIIVIGDVVADHPSFFAEEIQRVLEPSV